MLVLQPFVPRHGALSGLPHGLCSCFIVAFETWSVHVPEHSKSLRKGPSHVDSIRKVAQIRCTSSTSYPAQETKGPNMTTQHEEEEEEEGTT
jgi:hypothetical protein